MGGRPGPRFREGCARQAICPVLAHASYLVNLASSDAEPRPACGSTATPPASTRAPSAAVDFGRPWRDDRIRQLPGGVLETPKGPDNVLDCRTGHGITPWPPASACREASLDDLDCAPANARPEPGSGTCTDGKRVAAATSDVSIRTPRLAAPRG